jgi:hypothetical protein
MPAASKARDPRRSWHAIGDKAADGLHPHLHPDGGEGRAEQEPAQSQAPVPGLPPRPPVQGLVPPINVRRPPPPGSGLFTADGL